MEIENATLLSIGEIKTTKKGDKLVNITVQMPLGERKTFIIFKNKQSRFDLIKLFERGDHFKPGQKVSFNFNKAPESWQYDSIWKLKVRDEPRREQDTATTT